MVSLEKTVKLTVWEVVMVWLCLNYSRIMTTVEVGGILGDAADLF